MLDLEALRTYSEKFPNVNEVDTAAPALAYLGRILLENCSLCGEGARQKCHDLLTHDPALHEILKEGHIEKDFTLLGDTPLFRSLATFRLPATENIEGFLEAIRPAVTRIVRGETSVTNDWIPPHSESETFRHIKALQIPAINRHASDPLMLLHGLCTSAPDSPLGRRLNHIYRAGKHTFLLNTSGSGKTRLLFEGLCRYWGIYFTSSVDTSYLGSYDLTSIYSSRFPALAFSGSGARLPSADLPKYRSMALEENRKAAERVSGELLLARLLVFKQFLTLLQDDEPTVDHKRRWLLLQLRCSDIGDNHSDIFKTMMSFFRDVDDLYIADSVSHTLMDVRKLSGISHADGLYIAIDETNHAIQQYSRSFEDSGGHYPLLKEILRFWRRSTASVNGTFIVAGTELPRGIFQYEIGEWDDFRWCSDTGVHDNRELYESYMTRLLPPALRDSDSGKQLVQRMWTWLRGRYRATDSCLTYMLESRFLSPHSHLDSYISNFSTFEPKDGEKLKREEAEVTDKPFVAPISFTPLEYDPLLRFTVHEVLLYYLITSEHPQPFNWDRIEVVSKTFGRFGDTNAEKIVIDEPLNIAAVARWFTKSLSSFTDLSYVTRDLPQRPHSTAPYMALYLTHAFSSNRLLSSIFTFPGRVPSWANQVAHLVSLHSGIGNEAPRSTIIRPSDILSTVLATRAQSFNHTIDWLKHRHSTAFCIPSSANSDLLFVLRLANSQLVWVILRSRINGDVPEENSDLLDDLSKLLPENMFAETLVDDTSDPIENRTRITNCLKALPNRCREAGPCSILRVLAPFPTQAYLDQVTNNDPTVPPAATLNTSELQSIVHHCIAPTDVMKGIVQSILGKRKLPPGLSTPPPAKRQRPKASARIPYERFDSFESAPVAAGTRSRDKAQVVSLTRHEPRRRPAPDVTGTRRRARKAR